MDYLLRNIISQQKTLLVSGNNSTNNLIMKVSSPTLIRAWVRNYLESGSADYQNKSRKREPIMKVKSSLETHKDQKIEELERRLHHARLKLDCLKASRRLEQKKRTKRKHKLFKCSEKYKRKELFHIISLSKSSYH